MKKKIKLSKKDLDSALQSLKKDDSDLYISLGIGIEYEYAPEKCYYTAPPYAKIGLELWLLLSSEIYYLLCDPDNRRPKDWVQELISGDIRNLLTGIITAITSAYHVGLGIAVPAAALVIKKGLVNYCKRKPKGQGRKNYSKRLTKIINHYL